MAEQPEARAADTADFTFTVGEMQSDVLKVTGFTGEEGISRLFGFRIELCSDDANIDFNEVVGKSCVLEIAGAHGSRYVCGIVRQFEQTGEGVGPIGREEAIAAQCVVLLEDRGAGGGN